MAEMKPFMTEHGGGEGESQADDPTIWLKSGATTERICSVSSQQESDSLR